MKFSLKYTDTLGDNDYICWCKKVTKKTILDAIRDGAKTLADIKKTTQACTGNDCKNTNPLKRCCSKEIKELLED